MLNKTFTCFLAHITDSVIDIRKVQYLSPNCGGVEVKDRHHHSFSHEINFHHNSSDSVSHFVDPEHGGLTGTMIHPFIFYSSVFTLLC